jgi:hypothetical protein
MYVSPEARIKIRSIYSLRKNLGCPVHVKLDELHMSERFAENNSYGFSVFRSVA